MLVTYFSIVLGELVPKRLGRLDAERIARWAARPMNGLAILARPFVRLLSFSTDLLVGALAAGRRRASGTQLAFVIADYGEVLGIACRRPPTTSTGKAGASRWSTWTSAASTRCSRRGCLKAGLRG